MAEALADVPPNEVIVSSPPLEISTPVLFGVHEGGLVDRRESLGAEVPLRVRGCGSGEQGEGRNCAVGLEGSSHRRTEGSVNAGACGEAPADPDRVGREQIGRRLPDGGGGEEIAGQLHGAPCGSKRKDADVKKMCVAAGWERGGSWEGEGGERDSLCDSGVAEAGEERTCGAVFKN